MKPARIFLLRHGEGEGNLDETLFETKPDHQMVLTDRGRAQSFAAGQELRTLLNGERLRVYVSPYVRTHQTFNEMKIEDLVDIVREEPRLREQDWGNYQDGERVAKEKEERNRFGHFYYRMTHGESGADVYDRVSTFMESLHRDFADPTFPPNALLITHGLTMRLFLMRWFHWTVDYFESLENPHHCERRTLQFDVDHYKLDQDLRRWRS